jgi:tRNA(His) guanylyltransferase
MRRDDFETLGDTQKMFEMAEAGRRLMPGLPIMVRLDGRSFHTFTKGLKRPYDERMSRSMIETAKYLVEHTQANIGYTQSDEISLGFAPLTLDKNMLFDGRIQKLASVLASMASVKFNNEVQANIPEKAKLLPVFDARVWNVPNLQVAADHFRWREADATRNSLTMAAHAYYPHSELQKAGFAKKHDLLHAKGVNWNDYPVFFKRGTYVARRSVLKELTAKELSRIPVIHRPNGPVERSLVQELDMPVCTEIENFIEVLFNAAEPVKAGQLKRNS